MPASMPMRGFASARVVREPSPQTSPTARFYQCRDPPRSVMRRVRTRGRKWAPPSRGWYQCTSPVGARAQKSERRGISPSTQPLALLRLRVPWQPGTFEEELAPLARALDVITVGERMGI